MAERNVPCTEKLAAVEVESKLKQQALRDTMLSNEHLQRDIQRLHERIEAALEDVRVAHVEIEDEKKKQTLQRYYRNRAEDERRKADAVVRAGGIPTLSNGASGTHVALHDLELASADLDDKVVTTTRERDRLVQALKDMAHLRAKVEKATANQLSKNEGLATEVRDTKAAISGAIKETQRLTRALRTAEKEVAGATRQYENVVAENRDVVKHAQRLEKRLSGYEKEINAIQHSRLQVRRNVVDEATLAQQREDEMNALRQENKDLIQWLLDDADIVLPKPGDAADAGNTSERIDAIEKEMARREQRGAKTAVRKTEQREREERLFDELDAAIRRTSQAMTRR